MHAQTGYHIAFAHVSPAFRWYGPELYFDQLELRSKDDQPRARARRRRPGRRGHLAADSQRQAARRPHRARFAEHRQSARLGPTSFALASEIVLGGERAPSVGRSRLNDLPAGTLVIRHAVVTHAELELRSCRSSTLQDVNLDVRRGARGLALSFSAQLPPALGGSLSFSGTARGSGAHRQSGAGTRWRARSGISFPGGASCCRNI